MVLPGGSSFADQNADPRMLRAIGMASLCGDPIPIEKIEVFQLLIFLGTSKTKSLSEPLFHCNEKVKNYKSIKYEIHVLRVTGCRLRVTCCEFRVTGYELQVARLRMAQSEEMKFETGKMKLGCGNLLFL